MKKLFSILMMAIAMLTFSISTLAQAPTKKQRISREQLAEKQAQHIANSLAFDDKTRSQFVDTYTSARKRYGLLVLILVAIWLKQRRRQNSRLSSASRRVRKFSKFARSITRSTLSS